MFKKNILAYTKRFVYVCLLWGFCCHVLSAQEQMGMRFERHAGIWGAGINPANTAFLPEKWDFNVGSFDFFIENRYGYIKKAGVPKVLLNREDVFRIFDTTESRGIPSGALVLDFFLLSRKPNGIVSTEIMGPSASFKIGENHVIGFVTKFRGILSGYRMPEVLQYKTQIDLNRFDRVAIGPPTYGSGMAWAEAGLLYAWHNEEDYGYNISVGIAPKLLMGIEGGYFRVTNQFEYQKSNLDTLTFYNGDWDYAITTGAPRYLSEGGSYSPQINGRGAGLDLGFAISMPSDDADDDADYQWKLGVSLMDVGAIKFDQNAEQHRVVFENTINTLDSNFLHYTDLLGSIKDASQVFLGDPNASLHKQSFTIGLPTVLSAQFDYKLMPQIYVGGLWTQRLPFWKNPTKRSNVVAVVPRLERKWLSVSVPFVLNDWQDFHFGLAARLGYLVIGTDHLGSMVWQNKLSGTNFYIGLKINGNYAKLFKSRGGLRLKDRGWNKVGCFDF